jgi:predicted MFS family arabinose efflux permease
MQIPMSDEPAPADLSTETPDIDWTVLAPLLAHVVITHVVVGMVRVTTSYRTIELDLPVIWLGIISAGFAILPIFSAVKIGRFIDRGHDALATWIGSAIVLLACAGLWAWPNSATHLLVFTVVLGFGHMFLMAAQQVLTVRCATMRGRESAFGHFMVAVSIGQGLGPYTVGWIGGGATVPPTGPLFVIVVIAAVVCLAVSLAIRPGAREDGRDAPQDVIPIGTLLRLPGVLAVMTASVVTVTAGDLLVIYLPLLGAERNIDASHIGLLLLTRSLSALVARIFYARLIYAFGRAPLTLVSTFVGAAAFVLLAVPSLPVMYVAVVAIGLGLGIASTLTITGIVDVAPPQARGTAMSMRITGNRLGLAVMPFVASLVAAGTGVAGILLLTALSLATSAVAMQRSGRTP